MNVYTEHNIERWVERQIDILDCKYELGQITTAEYRIKMQEIDKQADRFYAIGARNDEPYVYEL